MYLWLAIDINDELADIRHTAEQITCKLGSTNSALTLPLHISLRISFPIEDEMFEKITTRIDEYYSMLSPFVVEILEIEKCGNIIWLKIQENTQLKRIHEDLVAILLHEFGVQPHSFDLSFLYHCSLFVDDDLIKVDEAYTYLRHESFPKSVQARKLTIGCSESGRAGEYSVFKEYCLCDKK